MKLGSCRKFWGTNKREIRNLVSREVEPCQQGFCLRPRSDMGPIHLLNVSSDFQFSWGAVPRTCAKTVLDTNCPLPEADFPNLPFCFPEAWPGRQVSYSPRPPSGNSVWGQSSPPFSACSVPSTPKMDTGRPSSARITCQRLGALGLRTGEKRRKR